MATVASIAKGQALATALSKVYGVSPRVEYLQNKTRVYYAPEDIARVRNAIKSKGPSDIEFDWLPIFRNDIIKQAFPYALGILAAGYILGKI